MTEDQKQAYNWAKNQNFRSVAAQYAKILAELVDELQAENHLIPMGKMGKAHEEQGES